MKYSRHLFVHFIYDCLGNCCGRSCLYRVVQCKSRNTKVIEIRIRGFFNYFETGKFETNSTNMLSAGLIFPDNLKTWIIGDGYMASGANDPYYIGPADYGFI